MLTPAGRRTTGELDLVEQVTGCRPKGCPWRAFWDEDVGQVIRVHPLYRKGQASLAIGPHSPAWLVDALRIYDTAFDAALESVRPPPPSSSAPREPQRGDHYVVGGGTR